MRVRAQVMERDDSSGGWVPQSGGGLSDVCVRKRLHASPSTVPGQEATKAKHEYHICGRRISDDSVRISTSSSTLDCNVRDCNRFQIVMSCVIKKDFEYYKVMPTFHHWRTEDKKFGLTFQTAADARAFDKGVRTAVEELLDGKLSSFKLTNCHNLL